MLGNSLISVAQIDFAEQTATFVAWGSETLSELFEVVGLCLPSCHLRLVRISRVDPESNSLYTFHCFTFKCIGYE